jgi:N utilization substance protein B
MGNRRKSRELAIQALFFMDMTDRFTEEKLSLFCDNFLPAAQVRPFFLHLVRGVSSARADIDTLIERFSSNWKIGRMSGVDRNVLRVGVFEMLCCPDIPFKVSINEAIDLGKKFGTDESGSFVNGILDSIRIAMEKERLTLQIPEDLGYIPDAPEPDLSETDSELAMENEVFPDFSTAPEPDRYLPADNASETNRPESSPPAGRPPRRTLIRK